MTVKKSTVAKKAAPKKAPAKKAAPKVEAKAAVKAAPKAADKSARLADLEKRLDRLEKIVELGVPKHLLSKF